MSCDLPNDLNIRDFWELPNREWKNITKYDFRYILKTFNIAKDQAHLAYSDDIKKLQNGLPSSSNRFKILEACRSVLKNIRKDKANKLFWETHAEKLLNLALNRAVNEEELTNIEQLTAIHVMKRRTTRENERDNVVHGSEAPNQKRKSRVEHDEPKQKKKNKEESFEDMFYAFQKSAALCAATGDGISVESHIYELLALKNIILLKPRQYSPSIRQHLKDRTLESLYNSLSQALHGNDKFFDENIASQVSDVIYVWIFDYLPVFKLFTFFLFY
ncbi:hypothetical protein BX666DRAFT_1943191 [Dichotomocladium elegans]|nr:hypothetical protein BX666DRAFT_1943191 [Dichotomocladium elegans]